MPKILAPAFLINEIKPIELFYLILIISNVATIFETRKYFYRQNKKNIGQISLNVTQSFVSFGVSL
ncbi:hypothetical protein FB1_12400 [Flavobacterium branchiophilum NBRC 15030 = ATCC 35035]|nr:hypothetical protein FB1_12400 [Flavobacterium branchiophilum NBRC 15030 = ATCC 35035]